jgi:hypothetical protein
MQLLAAQLSYGTGGLCSFYYHVYNGFGDHDFCFLFVVFVLFFLPFFIFFAFQKKRSADGFSTVKIENTPTFYNSAALHITGTV